MQRLLLLYKTADNKYYNYYPEVELDIYGQPVENGKIKRNYIKYYDKYYEYLGSKINLDDAEKIDVYDQVRLNWDYFVDYVWGHSKFCTDVV